jgi:hypothetical protein
MGPVETENFVAGSVPLTPEVIGTRLAVLQPTSDVAPAMHSTASNEVLGAKPVPVIITEPLLANPALGVTTGVAGAAAAPVVATPNAVNPPTAITTTAILLNARFMTKPSDLVRV